MSARQVPPLPLVEAATPNPKPTALGDACRPARPSRRPPALPGSGSACVSVSWDLPAHGTRFRNPATPGEGGCGVVIHFSLVLGGEEWGWVWDRGEGRGRAGADQLWHHEPPETASVGGQYPDQAPRTDRRTALLHGDSRWCMVPCGAEVMGGDSCVCTTSNKAIVDDMAAAT